MWQSRASRRDDANAVRHHGNAAAACEALIKAPGGEVAGGLAAELGSEKDLVDVLVRDDITAALAASRSSSRQQDAEPLDSSSNAVTASDIRPRRERRGCTRVWCPEDQPGIPTCARASQPGETADGSGTRNTSDPSKEASPSGPHLPFSQAQTQAADLQKSSTSRDCANETAALGPRKRRSRWTARPRVEMQTTSAKHMNGVRGTPKNADRSHRAPPRRPAARIASTVACRGCHRSPSPPPRSSATAVAARPRSAAGQGPAGGGDGRRSLKSLSTAAKVEEAQRKGFEREDELSDGDLEGVHDDLDALNDLQSLPPSQFNSNAEPQELDGTRPGSSAANQRCRRAAVEA